MRFPLTANRLAVAALASFLLTSFGLAPSPAAAATESQALAAAQRGAQWIASQQESDGSLGGFGGDWSMTALASRSSTRGRGGHAGAGACRLSTFVQSTAPLTMKARHMYCE